MFSENSDHSRNPQKIIARIIFFSIDRTATLEEAAQANHGGVPAVGFRNLPDRIKGSARA